jgi:hypothetical protein
MGIDVEIEGSDLVVRFSGADAVWAIAREVVVPLRLVRTACVADRKAVRPYALRLGGTSVPWYNAGRFWWRGKWEFRYTRRGDRVLVVECVDGARYDRLVLEVPDPDALAGRIAHAVTPA